MPSSYRTDTRTCANCSAGLRIGLKNDGAYSYCHLPPIHIVENHGTCDEFIPSGEFMGIRIIEDPMLPVNTMEVRGDLQTIRVGQGPPSGEAATCNASPESPDDAVPDIEAGTPPFLKSGGLADGVVGKDSGVGPSAAGTINDPIEVYDEFRWAIAILLMTHAKHFSDYVFEILDMHIIISGMALIDDGSRTLVDDAMELDDIINS